MWNTDEAQRVLTNKKPDIPWQCRRWRERGVATSCIFAYRQASGKYVKSKIELIELGDVRKLEELGKKGVTIRERGGGGLEVK